METVPKLRHLDNPNRKKTLYEEIPRHWDNPNLQLTS
jgi:hypothetical protein